MRGDDSELSSPRRPGAPEYNTVDASLWFLQAIEAYLRRFGRHEFVRECLWPAALEICGRYQSGTRFDIHADTDGLITGGSPQTQLTWMDAQCRGRPVTPRYGKAVEINALWISGLGLMADLAETLDLDAPPAAAETSQPPATGLRRPLLERGRRVPVRRRVSGRPAPRIDPAEPDPGGRVAARPARGRPGPRSRPDGGFGYLMVSL